MENKENLLNVEELRHAPLWKIKGRAFDLGAEAYRLKANKEANAAYFAASKTLGAITYAFSAVKQQFVQGWGNMKCNMGGFKYQVDRPKHLRGYSRVSPDSYELLGQK